MNTKGCLIFALSAAVLALIVGSIIAWNLFNGLIADKEVVDGQWVQMQHACQKRTEAVPGLLKILNGVAGIDRPVLDAVNRAWESLDKIEIDRAPDLQRMMEFDRVQGGLSRALSALIAATEKLPDLKANPAFVSARTQVESGGGRIIFERKRYNEVVATYNSRVKRFPTKLIARMAGFSERAAFDETQDFGKPSEWKAEKEGQG
jgi:LemA protein